MPFKGKITEKQAAEVKRLLIQGLSVNAVSKSLGVTYDTVKHIKSGKNWKNVPWPNGEIKKGTYGKKGEHNAFTAKLKSVEVQKIRSLLMVGKSHTEIKQSTNASYDQIYKIKNNITWKHLPWPEKRNTQYSPLQLRKVEYIDKTVNDKNVWITKAAIF